MATIDTQLNIIFAGTSEFALPSLEALLASKHKIVAIYTVPDRPAGRGQKSTASPVKHWALRHNIAIYQPVSLREPKEQQILKNLHADIMIDVAYGVLLPTEVLTACQLGCINVHPSLLPRWRGAAPIQRTLLAGDTETGVTVMQLDEGVDTGDILRQTKVTLNGDETADILQDRLALIGAQLLLATLDDLLLGKVKPVAQDNSLSCYANKITKEEGMINWNLSAKELERKIRAFNPWPVAFTTLSGQMVRIWQAIPLDFQDLGYSPEHFGVILNASKDGIDVMTGDGVLRLLKLQLPGGKILTVSEILNSKKRLFAKGARFND
jgi:methionyl-tRNA formyltransferase